MNLGSPQPWAGGVCSSSALHPCYPEWHINLVVVRGPWRGITGKQDNAALSPRRLGCASEPWSPQVPPTQFYRVQHVALADCETLGLPTAVSPWSSVLLVPPVAQRLRISANIVPRPHPAAADSLDFLLLCLCCYSSSSLLPLLPASQLLLLRRPRAWIIVAVVQHQFAARPVFVSSYRIPGWGIAARPLLLADYYYNDRVPTDHFATPPHCTKRAAAGAAARRCPPQSASKQQAGY